MRTFVLLVPNLLNKKSQHNERKMKEKWLFFTFSA